MLEHIQTATTLLGKDTVIFNIAMVAGFIQSLRCSNFLVSPLSATCCAIIVAIIYSWIAMFVVGFSPLTLKPFISIILIISTIYLIFSKRSCEPILEYKSGTTHLVVGPNAKRILDMDEKKDKPIVYTGRFV